MWEVEEESHESSGSERGKEEKEWESEDGESQGEVEDNGDDDGEIEEKVMEKKRRRRKSAKVRKVQVSKKYSLIHYRQNFYKCQCSKDVLLETNKFIQHLREGECQEHQEYNSHFLKKGRLVKNHKIDQKLLRKLYLLQNKIQKYLFICNCG